MAYDPKRPRPAVHDAGPAPVDALIEPTEPRQDHSTDAVAEGADAVATPQSTPGSSPAGDRHSSGGVPPAVLAAIGAALAALVVALVLRRRRGND